MTFSSMIYTANVNPTNNSIVAAVQAMVVNGTAIGTIKPSAYFLFAQTNTSATINSLQVVVPTMTLSTTTLGSDTNNTITFRVILKVTS